jgi:predicted ATPase
MKILKLHVEGFRSLKDITWEPGNLNVIIGPNASGKSNLLRFLELMSISAKGNLGKYIQTAGGMEPLVWDGSADKIEMELKCSPIEEGRLVERDSLTYGFSIKRIGKTSTYTIEKEQLANYYKVKLGTSNEPFKLLDRQGLKGYVFDEKQHQLLSPEEHIPEDETLLSMARGPFTRNHFITGFGNELASWCIYHDIHVNQDAAIRQPMIARSEKHIERDGQNLTSVLHTLYMTDRQFKKDINDAMKAAFGEDFDELVFPPAADQRIQLKVRLKSLDRELSAADLSDGTLRFLFLLTVLASPSIQPVIAIDEPESCLHPAMFSIIAEYAVEASKRAQIIFTTHSPEFLSAFKEIIPTTTVVQWENGQSVMKVLDGNELEYWLKGYSLGNLFKSGELENLVTNESSKK